MSRGFLELGFVWLKELDNWCPSTQQGIWQRGFCAMRRSAVWGQVLDEEPVRYQSGDVW